MAKKSTGLSAREKRARKNAIYTLSKKMDDPDLPPLTDEELKLFKPLGMSIHQYFGTDKQPFKINIIKSSGKK